MMMTKMTPAQNFVRETIQDLLFAAVEQGMYSTVSVLLAAEKSVVRDLGLACAAGTDHTPSPQVHILSRGKSEDFEQGA